MGQDTEGFVKPCMQCARGQASHVRSGGLLQPIPIPSLPWEELSFSLILGLFTTDDGHDAIVAIVCPLTKMAHFVTTRRTATTEDPVRTIIEDAARLHGLPRAIVSYRDTRFL